MPRLRLEPAPLPVVGIFDVFKVSFTASAVGTSTLAPFEFPPGTGLAFLGGGIPGLFPGIATGSVTVNAVVPPVPGVPEPASLVMLAAGLTGGWLMGHSPATSERFVMLDAEGRGQAPATAESPETRIVFHLTTPDQTEAGELLRDVEQMLKADQRDGQPLRVEIVSHGEGLDLLRTRLSKQCASLVAGEVSKNLVTHSLQDIRAHLPRQL